MKTIILKLMFAGAVSAAALCFEVPSSRAFGDAPWCSVVTIGPGAIAWDCEYRTVEECVPNVLAGNRGICSPNPWPGPATPKLATQHYPHQKRHVWR